MTSNDSESLSLSAVFSKLEKAQMCAESSEEPNSVSFQENIRLGLEVGIQCINMVNQLTLFSTNESISEMPTKQIRYMLCPAYLAYLTYKNQAEERTEILRKSRTYYKDFLKLIRDYSVCQVNLPDCDQGEEDEEEAKCKVSSSIMTIKQTAENRKSKIDLYKEQLEIKRKLESLKSNLSSLDEQTQREFYTKQLIYWTNIAHEELTSIDSEFKILNHMAKLKGKDTGSDSSLNKSNSTSVKSLPDNKSKAFQPFILTKSRMEANVFGAGYPSLPTYTIDEFYEKNYGKMNPNSVNSADPNLDSEKEIIKKEELLEKDDPETLLRSRAMDDWKDDNRRGCGNRYNRS